MDFTSGGGLGARVSYAGYPQYPAPPSAYPEGRGTAVPYRHPNAPGYAPRPAQYPIPGNGQFVHRLPPLNHNVQCIEDAAQILGGRLRGPQAFPPVFYDPANSEQPVVSSLPGVNPSQSDAPMQPADEKSFERVALPSEMPFGSNVHRQSRPTAGVIKISNIPYSITRQEVVHLVGRQSRLISSEKGTPIHVIMDRASAKTMDCYVEFETQADAEEAVARLSFFGKGGRAPRLGNRHVEVEMSTQEALLKELFPRAKCVSWKNGIPIILPNTDPYSKGFTGFITNEEMIAVVRHAETPHRSPFSTKCPQRTYESTISMINKFPWHSTGLYTVADRNLLFNVLYHQMRVLDSRIKKTNTIGLDRKLLCELMHTGLRCPAFNERMKFTLCTACNDYTPIIRFPVLANFFPFDTLVKIPGFDDQVVLYYVKLISNGTFDVMNTSGLPNNFPQDNEELKSPYGPIWFEWPDHLQPTMVWENAVQQEMTILCDLVLSGWVNLHRQATPDPLEELNRRLSTVTMGHESARSENPSPFNLRNLRIEDVAPFRPSNAPSENTSPFNLRNLSIEDVSPFRPSNARIEDVSPFSSRNTRTEDLSPLNSGNACPMIPLQGRRSHAEIYATPSRRAGEIERRVLEPIADAPNDHGSPVEHPPFPRYCRGRGFRGVRAGHGGFGGNGARGGFGHRNTVSYS